MLYFASVLLTPLLALGGTVFVFFALSVVLGESLSAPLRDLLALGVVVGTVLAAPVTFTVLPFKARRWQRGDMPASSVLLWSVATGIGSSVLLPSVLLVGTPGRTWPLLVLLAATGAAMAALGAVVLLAIARRLPFRSDGPATLRHSA